MCKSVVDRRNNGYFIISKQKYHKLTVFNHVKHHFSKKAAAYSLKHQQIDPSHKLEMHLMTKEASLI